MTDIDFIGDIHGHHEALVAMLQRLGYRERAGAFRHPSRKAVFLGDFVDRGPRQIETVDLVRRMRDAGSAEALMGNHEYNAIGFFREDGAGSHLRERSEKHRRQHQSFLDAVGEDSPLHAETIAFFESLPLHLEGPGWRAVHACWDPDEIAALAPCLDEKGRIASTAWETCFRKGEAALEACEILLKGPEIRLPEAAYFTDVDGNLRRSTRLRWWDEAADTIATAAIREEATREAVLPDDPLPWKTPISRESVVFFGHYWLKGEPAIVDAHHVCLDFSVAKGGPLVAYRFEGEKQADERALVAVRA